ncbi:MAG: NADP-dependent isocitrate dehydrogenase [Phycisphaeraceae bacterium]|nr:MAG: NADP-dependent isocitrate dehydrogenase [Phycisphaeraceae bacterium]
MNHSETGKKHRVTVIAGDGIGPEVVRATQQIIEAAGVRIDWEPMEAGAAVFKKGIASGVPQETIDSISRNRVALKGPLETPVGYGEKSANVTLRKLFELYGNLRPCVELPGIIAPFAGRKIDLIVVRENVEDLYAGIEHMQTPGVAQCLKLISRKGCEKIVRLAFEVAVAEGRKKVHCATKANIMKLTEGLLKRTFEEIAPEYKESHGIESEHIIIDNCAHLLVRTPEWFDVIVTTNMNGDIISDLTSGLTGGLGLAPSANIGNEAVMYEAVHGSAPTIAGKNIANPTAILLSGVMMLRHLGEFEAAMKIDHALRVTLSEGKALTVDIVGDRHPATTDEFTEAVIGNLGREAQNYTARAYRPIRLPRVDTRPDFVQVGERRTVGADVFVESASNAVELGRSLEGLSEGSALRLKMISNRGTRVYPPMEGGITDCVDHWRCRFILRDAGGDMQDADLLKLLEKVGSKHRWMHIEKLAMLDGKEAFSKAQGED